MFPVAQKVCPGPVDEEVELIDEDGELVADGGLDMGGRLVVFEKLEKGTELEMGEETVVFEKLVKGKEVDVTEGLATANELVVGEEVEPGKESLVGEELATSEELESGEGVETGEEFALDGELSVGDALNVDFSGGVEIGGGVAVEEELDSVKELDTGDRLDTGDEGEISVDRLAEERSLLMDGEWRILLDGLSVRSGELLLRLDVDEVIEGELKTIAEDGVDIEVEVGFTTHSEVDIVDARVRELAVNDDDENRDCEGDVGKDDGADKEDCEPLRTGDDDERLEGPASPSNLM
ncbi:hypothetical protein CGCS363_v004314 [Colletotrichum siamense]|uniref:uncharacterized protein n=1 Tax=Colletotrichum siamense TaxID=690259 RepID=UPI001872C6EC|nr:uncharacterized protein CGCS363_v004314 [Colletotrichum siamense]KAF5505971.1 hypothetical protein CGCS363_v004314 [Colletotrichum siamense]